MLLFERHYIEWIRDHAWRWSTSSTYISFWNVQSVSCKTFSFQTWCLWWNYHTHSYIMLQKWQVVMLSCSVANSSCNQYLDTTIASNMYSQVSHLSTLFCCSILMLMAHEWRTALRSTRYFIVKTVHGWNDSPSNYERVGECSEAGQW